MEHAMSEPVIQAGTTDRADINRENSQHSTGPRTATGKQRSSLNALRHGLTGHTVVLPSEDLAAYDRHAQDFVEEHRPKGATEKQLVQELSDSAWRLNRITALETNLLTLGATEHSATVVTAHPEAHHALAMAAAYRAHAREFANLSMYGQRLSRQFQKTLDKLREIQAARLEQEKQQLRRAAELLEMHEEEEDEEDTPYNPSEDGFVFSAGEIETVIHRRDRAAAS
jgi:hypothetical protein